MELSTTNPNKRTIQGSVDTLFLLDRQQTSFVNLFNIAKDFVSSKDPEGKWKDFWAGSVGTTLMQLMAGHSEYNAYNAITARREAYLFEAQQRSSAIAIASTFGYPVFRGQNLHLLITFVPSSTVSVKKFDIVGSMSTLDLVSLEEKVFNYGQKSELLVSVGKLMEESQTVPSSGTHWFRFYSPNVSEDILLKLNGKEVPHSREILSVLDDKFAVISNSVGGIDVLYINRYPPANWVPLTKYTFFDHIMPDYRWRKDHRYEVGDVVIRVSDTAVLPDFYTCMKAGISGSVEPEWPTIQGTTVDNGENTWSLSGKKSTPRFFKSITPGISVSGDKEPNWPNEVGAVVNEGEISWICTGTYNSSNYSYDTGDILKLMYIESEEVAFDSTKVNFDLGSANVITVQGIYQSPEDIPRIRETAPLYHETQHIIRGREDYRKLLKESLPNISDTNSFDVSPAVVSVTYVKDHTQVTWSPNSLINIGDEVLPRYQNGFIYKATRGGYTASDKYGTTLEMEPIWNTKEGSFTEDGQVLWKTLALNTVVTASKWRPKHTYNVGEYCLPTDEKAFPNVMFRVESINSEPDWPAMIGSKVVDNEVEWVCSDTIYLKGYEAEYHELDKKYEAGTYVRPVIETGYFYVAKNSGKSGLVEPEWPTTICDTVLDGSILWECYDLLKSEVYQKNTALRTLESCRPFGVQPPIIEDPVLVHVGLGIYLDLLKQVDEATVKEDLNAILSKYQKVLALDLRIVDFENAIEQSLDYCRVARVYSLENSKTKHWSEGMLVKDGDVVVPSDREIITRPVKLPSASSVDYTHTWPGIEDYGFDELLYRAKVVASNLNGKSSGYTSFPDRGISGETEPVWPKNKDETIKENLLTWKMIPKEEVETIPSAWQPNTTYMLGERATPSNIIFSNLIAEVSEIEFKEPDWPTTPNKSVRDNEVYWISFSPKERIIPLAWNEYYIFRTELKITVRGQEVG